MTKIINANNEQWILIEKDGYTLVDCGKKVKRLPFNISQTIEFFYKMGIMKK